MQAHVYRVPEADTEPAQALTDARIRAALATRWAKPAST